MTRSVGYDLHQVYPVTHPSCPVIFLLPSPQILTQGAANVLKGISTSLVLGILVGEAVARLVNGRCHFCDI